MYELECFSAFFQTIFQLNYCKEFFLNGLLSFHNFFEVFYYTYFNLEIMIVFLVRCPSFPAGGGGEGRGQVKGARNPPRGGGRTCVLVWLKAVADGGCVEK
jgi:hypothetical protein